MRRKKPGHRYVTFNRFDLQRLAELKEQIAISKALVDHMRAERMRLKLAIEIEKAERTGIVYEYNALLKKQKEHGLKLREGKEPPPGGIDLRGIRPIR